MKTAQEAYEQTFYQINYTYEIPDRIDKLINRKISCGKTHTTIDLKVLGISKKERTIVIAKLKELGYRVVRILLTDVYFVSWR